jgi:DHA3 family macrolide efflux protein-like MFS transporter
MAPTLAMLPAINGLVDGARRLARILGPGLVGALAAFIPVEQFFSIVALLLVVAAMLTYAVGPVPFDRPMALSTDWKRRVVDAIVAGWRATRPHRLLRFAIPSLLITTTAWCIAFMLGLALLVREMPGAEAQLYGVVVAAYGFGNFVSNVAVGSMRLRRSGLFMYLGRSVLGVGFIAMALAPTPEWLMVAAAFAAMGGPMNELPVLVRIQTDIPRPLVPAVFRLRLFMDHAGILLGLLAAPAFMVQFGTVPVVMFAGIATLLVGIVGLWLFGGEKMPEPAP